MAKSKNTDDRGTDAEASGTPITSGAFGRANPANADAGTFTASRRLYLDADGNVVEHDSPHKSSLLVAEGGTLPMKRARELGLVGEDGAEATGSRVVRSGAADVADGEDAPKAEADDNTSEGDAGKAEKAEAPAADGPAAGNPRPATTGRHAGGGK